MFLSSVSSSVSLIDSVFGRCEFDTHANTCALGSNFVPLSYTGRVCNVSPYNADQGECERNVPIITGATAYTCQYSGETFILSTRINGCGAIIHEEKSRSKGGGHQKFLLE
jgi:hypothetical protein